MTEIKIGDGRGKSHLSLEVDSQAGRSRLDVGNRFDEATVDVTIKDRGRTRPSLPSANQARLGNPSEHTVRVDTNAWTTRSAFAVGCVGLAFLSWVSLEPPAPSSAAWRILHPVLALCGAAFSIGLSSTAFIQIRFPIYKRGDVIGAQAFAVFLILLYAT